MTQSPRPPLAFTHYTATSCLGAGLQAHLDALNAGRSGLAPCDFDTVDLRTWTGTVAHVNDAPVPPALARFECRNHRLAQLALQQDGFAPAVHAVRDRVGARRVGVFMGTSTSGIFETELAYRKRDPQTGALPATLNYAGSHNPFSIAAFVQAWLGLEGPAESVSTACSSSGKVFASAWRMLETGLIDAAVVGGVDSLCLTTLYGFGSLEVLSDEPCRPFDVNRKGISIGEAAGFFLLERVGPETGPQAILLRGVGESSDAHHMSAPHPQGLGARMAMEQALAMGGAQTAEVGYINLHGTATPSNDSAEGKAVAALFGDRGVPCSSTKGHTGHALGAAGAVEAAIGALALREGIAFGGVNTHALDPEIPVDYLLQGRAQPLRAVLSNSFGFGGTNCSVLLGRAA